MSTAPSSARSNAPSAPTARTSSTNAARIAAATCSTGRCARARRWRNSRYRPNGSIGGPGADRAEPRRRQVVSMSARVLAIAGSDRGGGAGLHEDMRTQTLLGGLVMHALAALNQRSTTAVRGVTAVPDDMAVIPTASAVDEI